MKPIIFAVALLVASPMQANAVVCAKGVYRAGCAGPHGAVGVRRGPYGYGAAAVRPRYGAAYAHGCRWVNGVRVCR